MSHSHRDHRRGTFGTVLLAGACSLGAVAYGVFVGPSMLPPVAETTTAVSTDAGPPVDDGEEAVERGPAGHLRIQVSDRDRAWVQTLSCTGDLEEDSEVCAQLAEAASEFAGDLGDDTPAPEDAEATDAEGTDAEGTDAGGTGAERLFTEVRDGTVCTDKLYGPEEATIEGTWEGQEVETALTRQGSCEEARWQRLSALTGEIG